LFLAQGVAGLLGPGHAIDAVAELRYATRHGPQTLEVANLFKGGRGRVYPDWRGTVLKRRGGGQNDDHGGEHPNSF